MAAVKFVGGEVANPMFNKIESVDIAADESKGSRKANSGHKGSSAAQKLEVGVGWIDIVGMLRMAPALFRCTGAFATVTKCEYTDNNGNRSMVAVKKLKPEVMENQEDFDDFMTEVSLMRKLDHPYIVHYIGVGTEDNGQLFLGGALTGLVDDQMESDPGSVYSTHDAIRWCIHIAEALAYLHSSQPVVIHRDLKMENILLKGTDVKTQEAILTDFGLVAFLRKRKNQSFASPVCSPTKYQAQIPDLDIEYTANVNAIIKAQRTVSLKKMASGRFRSPGSAVARSLSLAPRVESVVQSKTGTLMYMAPEVYKNEAYDEKVDVWSFGMVMYEVTHEYLMAKTVVKLGTGEEMDRYAERVSRGYRCGSKYANDGFTRHWTCNADDGLIRSAAQDPKSRPPMKIVVERLKALKKIEKLRDLSGPVA
eukprot:gene8146-1394_t